MITIVPRSATLIAATPNPAALVEHAGRVCYRSEPKGDPDGFVRKLIRKGHESVIEHASATVEIVCERSLTHELVRHRVASYSQESQRYVAVRAGLEIILPGDLCEDEDVHAVLKAARVAFASYGRLLTRGGKPQDARAVLPNCAATRIVMSANAREWRHVLQLRLHPTAHPDMRRLMREIFASLHTWFPVAFEDIARAYPDALPSP